MLQLLILPFTVATKWIHKEVKFLQQSELRALQYPT